MEDDEDPPPFWLQSTTHRRRQVSSFFLSSGVLLVLLLVVAFFLVFVIVPSFVSFTSQIFRPHLVKKSWDSLNLVLVIFAVVCGFLNINTNNSSHETPRRSYYRERSLSDNVRQDRTPRSYHETSPRWYDQFQQDRTPKLSRLRSFSSYPDLRQEASWISNDQRWRFYDDTHINNYRLSTSDQINPDPPLHRETKEPEVFEEVLGSTETKDIAVDTVVSGQDKEVVYSQPAQSSPPPAPPSPPPQSPSRHTPQSSKMVRRKVKRSHQDVEINYARVGEKKLEEDKSFGIQPPSQAPPPPPPPPVYGKNEKRRGKDFLISLRRRKKKQRQKSVENLDAFFNLEASLPSLIPPPSPPPPPPPPPPPHFFQSIFSSKKGKTKKNQYINLAPPPPPQPPPPRTLARTRMEALASVSKPQIPPVITTQKPPKSLSTKSIEENPESGNASPLIPIPPPPPPPPFKIPAWKFLIEGDYVRVESFNSSRSGSPDIEENSDKESSSMSGGGEGAALPLFCPSPDVNTKADNFIARFKAGLRMEKINSVKGRSNLGLEGTSAETE